MARSPLITASLERSLMQARGVPNYALFDGYPRHYASLVTRVEVQGENGVKTIKPATQIEMFEDTIDSPYSRNYLYVMSSDVSESLSSQLALFIFKQAMDINRGKSRKPYWHVLDGSTKDKLRDDINYRETQVGNPSLLILSNVAVNSTTMKIEKLRDLLVQYSGVPRIVIASGCDPLRFCSEFLYVRPNKVLYFGRKEMS